MTAVLIVAWDLKNMNDVTDEDGNINADSHSKSLLAFKDKNLVSLFPARAEGIFYLQIGFGLCPASVCTKVLRLKVKGAEPVEFSAYSHCVDTWDADPPLQQLHRSLPKWSQNAYFTQFPSMLVSKSI